MTKLFRLKHLDLEGSAASFSKNFHKNFIFFIILQAISCLKSTTETLKKCLKHAGQHQ